GGPAQHDAIDGLEMGGGLREGGDATIDFDAQRGEVGFEPIHIVVAQWWYRTVFPWTQALENSLTGVYDEAIATGLSHRVDKVGHIFIAIQVIDANAVFHSDRQGGSLAHGLNAMRH